jgi:hypothetical protein
MTRFPSRLYGILVAAAVAACRAGEEQFGHVIARAGEREELAVRPLVDRTSKRYPLQRPTAPQTVFSRGTGRGAAWLAR